MPRAFSTEIFEDKPTDNRYWNCIS